MSHDEIAYPFQPMQGVVKTVHKESKEEAFRRICEDLYDPLLKDLIGRKRRSVFKDLKNTKEEDLLHQFLIVKMQSWEENQRGKGGKSFLFSKPYQIGRILRALHNFLLDVRRKTVNECKIFSSQEFTSLEGQYALEQVPPKDLKMKETFLNARFPPIPNHEGLKILRALKSLKRSTYDRASLLLFLEKHFVAKRLVMERLEHDFDFVEKVYPWNAEDLERRIRSDFPTNGEAWNHIFSQMKSEEEFLQAQDLASFFGVSAAIWHTWKKRARDQVCNEFGMETIQKYFPHWNVKKKKEDPE
jgi:hypothetical protein